LVVGGKASLVEGRVGPAGGGWEEGRLAHEARNRGAGAGTAMCLLHTCCCEVGLLMVLLSGAWQRGTMPAALTRLAVAPNPLAVLLMPAWHVLALAAAGRRPAGLNAQGNGRSARMVFRS
jgi:hypothetical protein